MFAHLNTKSRNYHHLCQVSKSSYSNSGGDKTIQAVGQVSGPIIEKNLDQL